MNKQASKLLSRVHQVVHLPKIVCNHVLGENHHLSHRMAVGVVIMFVGVGIAQFHSEIVIYTIFMHGFGYTLHAIGTMPVLDIVVKMNQEANQMQNEKQGRGKEEARIGSTQRDRSGASEVAVSQYQES